MLLIENDRYDILTQLIEQGLVPNLYSKFTM
jgi:hypothetical protein